MNKTIQTHFKVHTRRNKVKVIPYLILNSLSLPFNKINNSLIVSTLLRINQALSKKKSKIVINLPNHATFQANKTKQIQIKKSFVTAKKANVWNFTVTALDWIKIVMAVIV